MQAYKTESEILAKIRNGWHYTTLDMTDQDPKIIRQMHDYFISDLNSYRNYLGKLSGVGMFYFQFPSQIAIEVFFNQLDRMFAKRNIETKRL